ncbi:hypothetical protein [Pleurocapsa sp. FMAR1]|uniref:hypothetical protein n=1 Tax=Pleurocapsa sp. FMAR1 TaxID=3040204 RepID=UPI0029C92448|nr:hypothetical protein [Pleurocapsa sp. FMAR1]
MSTKIIEIETAIKQLPEKDVRQLTAWLQEYVNDIWDRQIESDLQSGRLNKLISKAEANIASNKVKEKN